MEGTPPRTTDEGDDGTKDRTPEEMTVGGQWTAFGVEGIRY